FIECGQPVSIDFGRFQHLVRPAPVGHIQQQSPGSIRRVGGAIPRELVANIIFRQHDRANPLPVVRFVFPHPQELGQRKVGQSWIAGQLDEPFRSYFFGQRTALAVGAHVAPDQCRTHHPPALIEHYCAVHLSGETQTSNGVPPQSGTLQSTWNSNRASGPPIVRLLLGPANLRRSKGSVLFRGGGNDTPVLVNNQDTRSAGSYVNPEYVDKLSPSRLLWVSESGGLAANSRMCGESTSCTLTDLL